MTLRIGIDIGGTFTDLVAITADERVLTHKVASTPHDYGEGIVAGFARCWLRSGGLPPPTSGLRGQRGPARHDDRLQHRARGQGRAHGVDHHAGLSRHPGNPRPAHAGAIRSALDQAARAGGAAAAPGGRRKAAPGWFGRDAAGSDERCRRDRHAARRACSERRDLPAALLCQPGA